MNLLARAVYLDPTRFLGLLWVHHGPQTQLLALELDRQDTAINRQLQGLRVGDEDGVFEDGAHWVGCLIPKRFMELVPFLGQPLQRLFLSLPVANKLAFNFTSENGPDLSRGFPVVTVPGVWIVNLFKNRTVHCQTRRATIVNVDWFAHNLPILVPLMWWNAAVDAKNDWEARHDADVKCVLL